MEVFEAVRTVLAVRAYQDKPLPSEAVHRIVEAGWLTASSMNGQPWHFIVVENRETLRQLAVLARTAIYCAGSDGNRGGDRKDALRGFGCESGHPIYDFDGVE